MTLYVQDSTGTTDYANSYVTVDEFRDYWTALGVDYSATTNTVIETYLIPATKYLDRRYVYNGYKSNGRDQWTQFPREELYDCSGEEPELVDGVPREVKDAQCEYAKLQADQGYLQLDGSVNGNIKRKLEKIGPITEETEYSPPGQAGDTVEYPVADGMIPKCFISAANSDGMAVHT